MGVLPFFEVRFPSRDPAVMPLPQSGQRLGSEFFLMTYFPNYPRTAEGFHHAIHSRSPVFSSPFGQIFVTTHWNPTGAE